MSLSLQQIFGSMDTELWIRLPHVAKEHILSFLPVLDRCRSRLVCKKWNRLLCKAESGRALICLQNENRDASFMVMLYRDPGGPKPSQIQSFRETGHGWCFLDLKDRRWYIAEDKLDQGLRLNFGGVHVAMDAYLAWKYLNDPNFVGTSTIVYNPIAKILKRLPTTPKHRSPQYFVELNMVVDSIIPQNFKIIYVHPSIHEMNVMGDLTMYLEDPFMHIYDSTTDAWQSVSKPRLMYLEIFMDSMHTSKSVMFQGLMYILLSFPDRREHMLWRYNLSENAWENVAVHIPGKLFMPKLIVSANRIFLVGWWEDLLSHARFQVSEINVPDLTREILFEWTKSGVKQLFEILTDSETVTEKCFGVTRFKVPGRVGVSKEVPGVVSKSIDCPSISSFGFGYSIMFMSLSSGSSMVYDVEAGSLLQLRHQKPLENIPDNSRNGWGRKQIVNLLLPNTIWWRGELLWTWQGA